jgi:hypothetical protein
MSRGLGVVYKRQAMGGSLFRLSGVSDGALKVFDASTIDVWFVPLAAPVTASATAGGQQ